MERDTVGHVVSHVGESCDPFHSNGAVRVTFLFFAFQVFTEHVFECDNIVACEGEQGALRIGGGHVPILP